MKKILVFGASSSKSSINKQLAIYASTLFKNVDVEILDLNDYEMPIYSIDLEKSNGIPNLAHNFYSKIGESDRWLNSRPSTFFDPENRCHRRTDSCAAGN